MPEATVTKRIWKHTKSTVSSFAADDCPRKAAALSFYTILSLPALLLVVLWLLGQFIDTELIRGELQRQIRLLFGPNAARRMLGILRFAKRPDTGGILTALFGILALLFGATNAFAQLQRALNDVWNVKPGPARGGVKNFLLKRLFSFGMLLLFALFLIISLLISTVLSSLGDFIRQYAPAFLSRPMLIALSIVINWGVIMTIFAFTFKVLPDARTHWKDIWAGAFFTTLMFMIGKWVIGYYIGHSNPGNAYGAAGSIIIILIWIYLSSMLLLLGAEFTKTRAEFHGRSPMPAKHAVKMQHITENRPEEG